MTRDGIPGPRLPVAPRITDPAVRQVLDDHKRAIEDTAKLPGAGLRVIPNVQLADGVDTPVAHGLGRPPSWVRESCPRGLTSSVLGATGRVVRILSITGPSADPSRFVVLRAAGWGATIEVDVLVCP